MNFDLAFLSLNCCLFLAICFWVNSQMQIDLINSAYDTFHNMVSEAANQTDQTDLMSRLAALDAADMYLEACLGADRYEWP